MEIMQPALPEEAVRKVATAISNAVMPAPKPKPIPKEVKKKPAIKKKKR